MHVLWTHSIQASLQSSGCRRSGSLEGELHKAGIGGLSSTRQPVRA